MENIMDKTDLEEKYEIALNKMYFTLHKIIKLLEEEKEKEIPIEAEVIEVTDIDTETLNDAINNNVKTEDIEE